MKIADNNNASVKVANLSTYILPEFYIYRTFPNDTHTFEWVDAVDCKAYFT